MRKLFFITILLFPILTFSQIINVESLRKVTDTSGWTGNTSLNFSLTKNTNTLIRLNNNIHVQYKMNRHLVLFVNNLGFERAGEQSFVNNGSQHLRYNYKLSDLIVWEGFVQSQYNSIAKIKFRGLAGTGPRFKLLGDEKYRMYIGTLVMYEHEELNEENLVINRDWRSSNYLSLSFYPTDNITFVSTTYYQPRISQFDDYRIATENSFVLGILEKLSLRLTYTLTFDATPATGVPNTFYNLSTGLLYAFD
jgi:putative salt-induced outer membrane protein YdiY